MKFAYDILSRISFILAIVKLIGDHYESAFFFLLTAILFAIHANGEAEGE